MSAPSSPTLVWETNTFLCGGRRTPIWRFSNVPNFTFLISFVSFTNCVSWFPDWKFQLIILRAVQKITDLSTFNKQKLVWPAPAAPEFAWLPSLQIFCKKMANLFVLADTCIVRSLTTISCSFCFSILQLSQPGSVCFAPESDGDIGH